MRSQPERSRRSLARDNKKPCQCLLSKETSQLHSDGLVGFPSTAWCLAHAIPVTRMVAGESARCSYQRQQAHVWSVTSRLVTSEERSIRVGADRGLQSRSSPGAPRPEVSRDES